MAMVVETARAVGRLAEPVQGGAEVEVVRIVPREVSGRRFAVAREPQLGDPEFERDEAG
jgi:hypothetical protein